MRLSIVLTLPPRYRCLLDRLPASRLLPPRSGLERSDFVHWPYPEVFEIGDDFRLGGYCGKHLLTLSSSLRDPEPTPQVESFDDGVPGI